jgi:ATP-dependent DNA helicase DinG
LLSPFLGVAASIDLMTADKLTPYIKRRVCVSGSCGKECPFGAECRYRRFLTRAGSPEIDFQITNHNYLLADARRRSSGDNPLLPDYQLLIIDEAHKFLQAARSMYGAELTDAEISELAGGIHAFIPDRPEGGVNIHDLAENMREHCRKLFKRLDENIPKEQKADDEAERYTAVMDDAACRFLQNITEGSAKIADALAGRKVQPIFQERKAKTIQRLHILRERAAALGEKDMRIRWLEKQAGNGIATSVLHAIPTDLDARLHRDLWSRGFPIVLTSGTLSAFGHGASGRDFSRAKETLGLIHMPRNRVFEASMASPFDFWNNSLLYISDRVPFPDNKDKRYISAVADEIERLALASHGHAAVLFTSYNVMGQVYSLVKSRGLPFPLFRMERGSPTAIERFKKSGNGVLFAAGAMWEGIDIPGDALSMLIIVKLPFAVPDPIGDYERSLCGNLETYRRRVLLPDMDVRLQQGAGRLLRTERDTGCYAILDIRASDSGAYHRYTLAAFPGRRYTSDLEDVRNFFEAVKPPSYFNLTGGVVLA